VSPGLAEPSPLVHLDRSAVEGGDVQDHALRAEKDPPELNTRSEELKAERVQ
jgi:hypothetical protein